MDYNIFLQHGVMILEKHFKKHILFHLPLALCIALFTIILIIKISLNTKVIYYYDVVKLDLPKISKLSIEEIKSNYQYVINFVQNTSEDFHLPTLPYSKEGKIHFEEVRNIFIFLDKLQFILFLTIFIIFILNIKYHNYIFLKYSAISLLLLPLICAIPFSLNFDKSFTAFHKLFFNNDYWLLDIKSDPIINIMPQEFFFHSAIFIITLLILGSLLFYLIYKLIMHKK
jgi:integral membrane protein (TIGR01906 family)